MSFLSGITDKLDYRLRSLAVVACGAHAMVAMGLFVLPRACVDICGPFIIDLFAERAGVLMQLVSQRSTS